MTENSKTVRARVTVTQTSTTTRDLLIIDVANPPDPVELDALGYNLDSEVGVLLGDVPSGVSYRKPMGETAYVRVSRLLNRMLNVEHDSRILGVLPDGRFSLDDASRVVIVRVRDLISEDAFDFALEDK